MRYKIFLVFIFLFACNSSAKDHADISKLGFYSTPEQIIKQLSPNPVSPEENFLLGITYKKQNNLRSALRYFADSAYKSHKSGDTKLYPQPVYSFLKKTNPKSPYYDDAVNEIAAIFLQHKEYEYAIKIAKLAGNSSHRVSVETTLTIVSSLVGQKKDDEAVQLLSAKLKKTNSKIAQSQLYMRRAGLYEKNSNHSLAIKDYMSILELNPSIWRAGLAAQRIHRLASDNKINISEDVLIATTTALIKNKNFNEARTLNAMVNANSRKTEHIQNRIRLLIRNNQQAAFEVLNIYTKDSYEYQNMLFFFAEELRASNRNASIQYYDMLKSSQNKDLRLKALLRAGNIYERNNSSLYKRYYDEYISLNGDPLEIQRMFWLMARHELKERNNEAAKQLLLKSVNASSDGSYSARAYFWLYKIFSKENNASAAEEALSNLISKHPNSVYSWAVLDTLKEAHSKDNLKKLFEDAKKSGNIDRILFLHNLMFFTGADKNETKNRKASLPTFITNPYNNLENNITKTTRTAFSETRKFFAIGSSEYINKTLDYIPENTDSNEIKYGTLTKFSIEFNHPGLALSNMLKLMRAMSIKENLALMGETSIKAIIPQGFEPFVKSASREFSVPENLIYAITKAESLFSHQAVSSAGATGLMQLMPATAADVARHLKISEYSLTNPEISIKFGTSYIAWLNRFFNNQHTIFIKAAYNAGPGHVDKWRKTIDTTDMDYFTEFVPFRETNYYIVRVGKFHKQYNLIYGVR